MNTDKGVEFTDWGLALGYICRNVWWYVETDPGANRIVASVRDEYDKPVLRLEIRRIGSRFEVHNTKDNETIAAANIDDVFNVIENEMIAAVTQKTYFAFYVVVYAYA